MDAWTQEQLLTKLERIAQALESIQTILEAQTKEQVDEAVTEPRVQGGRCIDCGFERCCLACRSEVTDGPE